MDTADLMKRPYTADMVDDLHWLLRYYTLGAANTVGGWKELELRRPHDDSHREKCRKHTLRNLTYFMLEVERLVRINELERIQSATLDADSDVWTTRNGEIMSLTERLEELKSERLDEEEVDAIIDATLRKPIRANQGGTADGNFDSNPGAPRRTCPN